jgi:dTDP-4-amino-4,6-dideoxygalactose transaminase
VTGAPEILPLVDLAAQHREVADEVEAGFARVLAATAFVHGEDVSAFEAEFAAFCEAPHCVGVANGTDAIELSLRALDVGPGDEVILPTNSFVATAEAVARAGATPVLVDCDPVHHLIDADQVAQRMVPTTAAVVPVHLYGQVAPMERLTGLGVPVVEDAAQSQGARRHGTAIGGFGDVAATSFYPGKNLGAYGDAGAVVTRSADLARRIRLLGDHGSPSRYEHTEVGWNSRLDTLQAVVLRAKLRRLAAWNEERRLAARRYDDLLRGVEGVTVPATLEGNEHVWHLYVVRVAGGRRNHALASLHRDGIRAAIHYPTPIHLTAAFSSLGHGPGDFPVSEQAAAEVLSLPMHPHLTPAHQERVVESLARALA